MTIKFSWPKFNVISEDKAGRKDVVTAVDYTCIATEGKFTASREGRLVFFPPAPPPEDPKDDTFKPLSKLTREEVLGFHEAQVKAHVYDPLTKELAEKQGKPLEKVTSFGDDDPL